MPSSRCPPSPPCSPKGRLSWEQLRAVTRFATPEGDATWAEEAPGCSVAGLEATARRLRPVPEPEVAEAGRRRSLRWRWDEHHHLLRLSGRLPDAEGAIVVRVLDRLAS